MSLGILPSRNCGRVGRGPRTLSTDSIVDAVVDRDVIGIDVTCAKPQGTELGELSYSRSIPAVAVVADLGGLADRW